MVFVAIKRQQQELAAPPRPPKTAPDKARRKVFRQRPAQVGPADMGGDRPTVLQRRHQRAPHGFDLGKFRHG